MPDPAIRIRIHYSYVDYVAGPGSARAPIPEYENTLLMQGQIHRSSRRMHCRSRLPVPIVVLGLALVLLPLSACGDGPTDPEPATNETVLLSPSTLTFDALGQTAQLELVVLDGDGDEVFRVDVTGVSSDPDVVTVDSTGLVTAVGEGSATITTAAADVSNEVSVTVDQVVTDVVLDAAEATIDVGQSTDFDGTGLDANENEVADAAFAWSSTDPTVASVDEEGTVTGLAEGTTTIRAESADGPFAEAHVTVQ